MHLVYPFRLDLKILCFIDLYDLPFNTPPSVMTLFCIDFFVHHTKASYYCRIPIEYLIDFLIDLMMGHPPDA